MYTLTDITLQGHSGSPETTFDRWLSVATFPRCSDLSLKNHTTYLIGRPCSWWPIEISELGLVHTKTGLAGYQMVKDFRRYFKLFWYNHRLRGSASPVLTATHHSYGSLADFLTFSPQP